MFSRVRNLVSNLLSFRKEKCDCGKIAQYLLISASKDYGNPYYCDDCVPRGCSCNLEPKDGDWNNPNPEDWYQPLDEKGREYPCIEYMYSSKGYKRRKK